MFASTAPVLATSSPRKDNKALTCDYCGITGVFINGLKFTQARSMTIFLKLMESALQLGILTVGGKSIERIVSSLFEHISMS